MQTPTHHLFRPTKPRYILPNSGNVTRSHARQTSLRKRIPLLLILGVLPAFSQAPDRKPDDYTFGPDSQIHEGIPQGTWDKITWKSEIFPNIERVVWTYVPAQYDPKKPACLPVIITVFIDPGSGDIHGRNGNPNFSNRSFEYDTLSDQYNPVPRERNPPARRAEIQPDQPTRDWYLQNKLLHEALAQKGYEVKYVLGDGLHSSKHGGAILPDSLRWLFSDQAPKQTSK